MRGYAPEQKESKGALGQVVRAWRAALPPQGGEGRRGKGHHIRINYAGRQETNRMSGFVVNGHNNIKKRNGCGWDPQQPN